MNHQSVCGDVGCVCGHILLNRVTSLCDLLFLPRETSVTSFLIFVMHHQPEEKQYYRVEDIVLWSLIIECTQELVSLKCQWSCSEMVGTHLSVSEIPTGDCAPSHHHLPQRKYTHARAKHKLPHWVPEFQFSVVAAGGRQEMQNVDSDLAPCHYSFIFTSVWVLPKIS